MSATKQPKVSEDVAAQEFARLCEANRVETDESALDKDELEAWKGLRDPIIRDICRGLLTVDPEGRAVYTPPGGKALTFQVPSGATLIALETHKGKDISNTLAAIGEMTGQPQGSFARMHARDVQALSRLVRLFLADQ